jgi:hypothetical protein
MMRAEVIVPTPILAPAVESLPQPCVQALPESVRSGRTPAFLVVTEGTFEGKFYPAGVVLVSGLGDANDAVILVARGYGRPRFGTIADGRLYGDAGEPCSAARWMSVGPVAAVLHPARAVPQLALFAA